MALWANEGVFDLCGTAGLAVLSFAHGFAFFLMGLAVLTGLSYLSRIAPAQGLRLFGVLAILVALANWLLLVPARGTPLHTMAMLLWALALGALALSGVRLWRAAVAKRRYLVEDDSEAQAVRSERERIARELHDGALQSLYALGLGLESAVCLAEGVPPSVRDQTREILNALQAAMSDIRRHVMDLKSSGASAPLHERLADIVAKMQQATDAVVELRATPVATSECGATEADHICQIVREALSNALRHGKPEHVTVDMVRAGGSIQLTVGDDGGGFVPPTQAAGSAHHGLENMRQRAEILGGTLDVHTTPGVGTTVSLQLPLKGGLE